MALNKLKDKLKNIASGETLGEAVTGPQSDNLEDSPLQRKGPSTKKTGKIKKSSKPRRPRERSSSAKEVSGGTPTAPLADDNAMLRRAQREERAERYSAKNRNKTEPSENKNKVEVSEPTKRASRKSHELNDFKGAVDGYKQILKMEGVKEELDVDVEFKSADLDYVQFSQTVPEGFDYEEVTDFISRVKYTVHKLETALTQRNKDVVILASAVKKTEQKMVDAKNEEELARMIGGQTEEERLIEENINQKIRITNLEKRLKEAAANKGSIEEMSSKIDALESENEYLRISMSETPSSPGLPSIPKTPGLPKLDDKLDVKDEMDSFDAMLEDIGGLYDDE